MSPHQLDKQEMIFVGSNGTSFRLVLSLFIFIFIIIIIIINIFIIIIIVSMFDGRFYVLRVVWDTDYQYRWMT